MTFSLREIARDLQFPEGPIAMPDGSVILVEIRRGTLTRILPDGSKRIVAELGGGPNGAAIGPDGACYVCNNGGFSWPMVHGHHVPGPQPEDYVSGSIQRVDLATGEWTTIYSECDGRPLRGPNDIVFDAYGGFWFTDLGKRRAREQDLGAIYYAKADGSAIREVIFPMDRPNGIGLSPDGNTLYVAETPTGRVWKFMLSGPGEIIHAHGAYRDEPGEVLAGLPGYQLFDSLAIEASGAVCVATLVNGGITVFDPEDGHVIEHVSTGDPHTTNIAFGGPDLRTAYVTLSSEGRLVAIDWPRPGARLFGQPE